MLDAPVGAEWQATLGNRFVHVIEQRRARMLYLGRAPARPWQAVVLAFHRVGRADGRGGMEFVLVLHVQLEALGALAGVADRPGAAVDLTQNVLGNRLVVLHLDVFHELVTVAELASK